MAEHGDLDVFGVLAAEASEQHADKPPCHEVEEGHSQRPIVAYCPLPAQRPGQVSEPYAGLPGRGCLAGVACSDGAVNTYRMTDSRSVLLAAAT